MYDELDWEDIESMLYSQVYHISGENHENDYNLGSNSCTNNPQNTNNATKRSTRFNNRYFNLEQDVLSKSPIYISIGPKSNNTPNEICKSMQNNISIESNGLISGPADKIQNNITINQYSIPLIISNIHETDVIDSHGKLLAINSNSNRQQKLLEKKKRRRGKNYAKRREKRKRKAEQILNESKMKQNKNEETDDIVCVSDDDSQCMIVHQVDPPIQIIKEKPTQFPTKFKDDDENAKKPESDDDIIYVPPPPVEVINIDVDEVKDCEKDGVPIGAMHNNLSEYAENQNNQQSELSPGKFHDILASQPFPKPGIVTYNPIERKELLCTPESSNDFLENTGIENNSGKFNFSLHGSDFNSAAVDFVKPANPVEFCETESSCSTNELNRDFNNSVKTIVFDEVEFPKADIFSENNLESFGTFITPKRNVKILKPQSNKKKTGIDKSKEIDLETSSDSSSESDYESSSESSGNVKVVKDSRKLPNLSPMECGENVSEEYSKKKTASNFFNKHTVLPKETKQESSKRKSDAFEISESDSDSSIKVVSPDIKIKHQRKKPKCREEANELSKKKKGKKAVIYNKPNKKKKNLFLQTSSSESDDQINSDIPERQFGIENVETKRVFDSKSDSIYNKHLETAIKKKKKKKRSISLEPKKPSELPENEDGCNSEKKKKSVSPDCAKIEVNMPLLKKSKKRRKSCSSSASNKSTDIIQDEDEYIDVELLDDHDIANISKTHNEEIDSVINQPFQLQENQKIFHSIPEQKTDSHAEQNYQVTLDNFATITKTSTPHMEHQDSDEEIVVDDEIEHNVSDLIVIDEVNCTVIEEEVIKVVSSSDSDDDFKDLTDVGKNIELANCSLNIDKANSSEEIVVVDDNSQSNSADVEADVTAQNNSSAEFDVDAIHRRQTDDPESWKISHKDRTLYLNTLNTERTKKQRCNRCRQLGHIAVRCTEKRGPLKCCLCGDIGHLEPRCTKKICTQCGNEGEYSTTYCWKCFKFRNSICRICNMKGHLAKTCPDLWRRYHLTTEEGPVIVSKEPQLKPREEQWCSGCAKQGHLEHECNYYNRTHPPTNPCIMSYEDVLYENVQKLPEEVTSQPVIDFSNQNHTIPSNTYEASNFNIPSLMSLNVPLPTFCENLPSVLPSDTIGTLHIVPPIRSSTSQQTEEKESQVNVQIDGNCIVGLSNNVSLKTDVVQSPPALSDSSLKMLRTTKNMILDKMRLAYLNGVITDIPKVDGYFQPHHMKKDSKEFLQNDQRRIKHIIMSMSCHKIREFLKREMSNVEDIATQSDPRYLRKMLFRFDGLWRSKKPIQHIYFKEQYFWNKVLNIYLFGVHKLRDGALHLNYLQSFLSESKRTKLDLHKRKSIFNSYCYIFGVERHNMNYYKLINKIIENYSQGRQMDK